MKWGAKFVDVLGHRNAVIQTGPEPAIVRWAELAASKCERNTTTRQSPRHRPTSNGGAHRAVGILAGQARALKLELEKNSNTTLDIDEAMITCIIRHAGWTWSRFHKGGTSWSAVNDGKRCCREMRQEQGQSEVL